MTLPRIRRSEFEALLSCPNYDNDSSEAAAFGTDVHAAIAAWIRSCEAMQDTVEPVMAMVPRADESVFTLLQEFTQTHTPGLDTLYDVECLIEHETDLAILTGTLDRLDTWVTDDGLDALISDWKSGWHPVENAFQQKWYGSLVCLTFPSVQTVTMRTDYIRLSEGRGITDVVMLRPELLEWWDTHVVPYIPRVLEARANGGPAEGGAACQYCRRRYECADSIAPYRNAPQTAEQAAEMVGELVRLEAAAKEREKALRVYLEEREPLIVNGLSAGFKLTGGNLTVDRKAAEAAGLMKRSEAKATWGVRKA